MPIALHNAVDDDESSEASYRRITPAEFAKLDPNTVTLLDLREPADFAAHPVEEMCIRDRPNADSLTSSLICLQSMVSRSLHD